MSLSLCVDALGQCPTGSSSSAFTLNISDKHAKPPQEPFTVYLEWSGFRVRIEGTRLPPSVSGG